MSGLAIFAYCLIPIGCYFWYLGDEYKNRKHILLGSIIIIAALVCVGISEIK